MVLPDERRIKISRQRSTYRFASDPGTPQLTPLACARRVPQAMAGRICAAPSPASAWSATFIESPPTRLSSPLEAHTQPPTLHSTDLEYTYQGRRALTSPSARDLPCHPALPGTPNQFDAQRGFFDSTSRLPSRLRPVRPRPKLFSIRFLSRGGATPHHSPHVLIQYWPRSACRPRAPRLPGACG